MSRLKLDLREKHEISPYLYMQFMEPLGCADASVDAAWDFGEDDWYPCVVDKLKELSPTMMRFGGCFASYYHWREGIGPQSARVPMRNHCWGGRYANQVGAHEFIDLCRRVGCEPLMVVNMASEGLRSWQYPKNDTVRLGTAEEAAEWVRYCNAPSEPLRSANGSPEPFGIRYWQIGNETSYSQCGERGYNAEQCYDATSRFVERMREADPSIRAIGWGDAAADDARWCERMSRVDGIDILAFHHHHGCDSEASPLYGLNYRGDPSGAWDALMSSAQPLEEHITRMREQCGDKRLAMTEGHFIIPGRNRNELLSAWMTGVAYARWHNVMMRNSDILEIATMADLLGNVWQCNAMIVPAPMRKDSTCYLQPVGEVMRLFGRHQGRRALDITCEGNVDAVASAGDGCVYLHLANTSMSRSENVTLELGGATVKSGRMFCIATDPQTEITPLNVGCFAEAVTELNGSSFTLPAAAVAAVELRIE